MKICVGSLCLRMASHSVKHHLPEPYDGDSSWTACRWHPKGWTVALLLCSRKRWDNHPKNDENCQQNLKQPEGQSWFKCENVHASFASPWVSFLFGFPDDRSFLRLLSGTLVCLEAAAGQHVWICLRCMREKKNRRKKHPEVSCGFFYVKIETDFPKQNPENCLPKVEIFPPTGLPMQPKSQLFDFSFPFQLFQERLSPSSQRKSKHFPHISCPVLHETSELDLLWTMVILWLWWFYGFTIVLSYNSF